MTNEVRVLWYVVSISEVSEHLLQVKYMFFDKWYPQLKWCLFQNKWYFMPGGKPDRRMITTDEKPYSCTITLNGYNEIRQVRTFLIVGQLLMRVPTQPMRTDGTKKYMNNKWTTLENDGQDARKYVIRQGCSRDKLHSLPTVCLVATFSSTCLKCWLLETKSHCTPGRSSYAVVTTLYA